MINTGIYDELVIGKFGQTTVLYLGNCLFDSSCRLHGGLISYGGPGSSSAKVGEVV